jgi:hypothetical protein
MQLHIDLDSLRVNDEPVNSQTFKFSFPPEFSTACEQYLLYFHEFLAEVGIAATTDIGHKAGKVLFTVTPESPDEALEKIRQALSIYCHLPVIANTSFDLSDGIAVRVMGAQILHLESQLMYVTAALECKTIELQNRNAQLAMMLIQSYDHKSNDEELLGGLIRVGDVELGKSGIRISLSEIVRRVKKFFAEKD